MRDARIGLTSGHMHDLSAMLLRVYLGTRARATRRSNSPRLAVDGLVRARRCLDMFNPASAVFRALLRRPLVMACLT
jgi:hypothetical protein